jgi:dihydrofolate reductase
MNRTELQQHCEVVADRPAFGDTPGRQPVGKGGVPNVGARGVNDLERSVGTYLYGRRMYETMRYWETAHTVAGRRPVSLDFAQIWQAADKIVYSTTLQAPDSARTHVERDFDPDQIRKLKEAADRDLTVGGAHLAAQAIAAGLVDEYQLFAVPAIVGGGTRALPDLVRLNLALAEERRFGNGTVYLCYRPA